jgi:hypothetical protein
MLGLEEGTVHQCAEGWVPVYADREQRLSVMSIGFLLGASDDPVVWRGPKKTGMIQQFITQVPRHASVTLAWLFRSSIAARHRSPLPELARHSLPFRVKMWGFIAHTGS